MDMEYKHFSHPHTLKLQLIKKHNGSPSPVCSGCESAVSGPAYVCSSQGCEFSLHQDCGNAARGMQHPSHVLHHLTLVPYTTYSAGTFLCGACGREGGKGFSYCCPLCDFDVHARCALLPQVTAHESHPLHNLLLVHNSVPPTPTLAYHHQFGFSNQFVCSLCNQLMDFRFWSYNCYACNYHIHASCALNGPMSETETKGSVAGEAGETGETSKQSVTTEAPKTEREDIINAKTEEDVPGSGSGSGSGSGTEQIQPGTEQIQTGSTSQAEDQELRHRLELEQLKLQMQMSTALADMMGSFNLSSFV